MKIDWAQKLYNFDGKEIKRGEDESWTLGKVAIESLLADSQEERHLSGEEKVKRYLLSKKIFCNPGTEFTVEEIAKVKEQVGKKFPTVIAGQIPALLDSAEEST